MAVGVLTSVEVPLASLWKISELQAQFVVPPQPFATNKQVHLHLIYSGALINQLAGGIGDKVGYGNDAGKRRTGGFGKRPCGLRRKTR